MRPLQRAAQKLRSFILPAAPPAAAHLHVARTVVRRAERSVWAASAARADAATAMNPLAATYLNRLSDLLFILARCANRAGGDVLWQPGGGREQDPRTSLTPDRDTTSLRLGAVLAASASR